MPDTLIGRRPPRYRVPETTHLGRARLAVSNLERAVAFYSGIIGLAVLESDTAEAGVVRLGPQGGTQALLELQELPGLMPLGKRRRLGLYHTAFLLPRREALSSFIQHLIARKVAFASADHVVSEALYLTDPDGLTVEVYQDRPRSQWQTRGGEIQMGVDPMRFAEMPAVATDSWQGAPLGTTLGHVHFYVGDLKAAARFYHEGLGLDQSAWSLPGALFMSAGGYHHHVGVNSWAAGSPVASAQDPRLLFWELALPDAKGIEMVTASMRAAGYTESLTAQGARAFVDDWGLMVFLVVSAG